MRVFPIVSAVAVACSSLAGCATASKDVPTAYVSPLQYQSYDCTQIAMEGQRLNARVSELGGRLDTAADHDKAIAGVGAILFWPALFALGGTKAQEAEYARLRGEHDAIEQASISKRCGVAAPLVADTAPAVTPVAAVEPAPIAAPVSSPVK